MSDVGLTSNQISAAGAYAQADRLVASIPVRAIDPTRQRFQVEDQSSSENASTGAQDATDGGDGSFSSSSQSQGQAATTGRFGYGLVGAVTSFLARIFGQGETTQTSAAASMQSGTQAYARAAGAVPLQDGGTEILSPSFPRLSSGRAVDLVV